MAGVNTGGGSQTEELLVFILYRKDPDAFIHLAKQVLEIICTQVGIKVDHVIPVLRIPKTTSGKIQRAQLVNAYLDGKFDSLLAKVTLKISSSETIENDLVIAQLSAICKEFVGERTITVDDNLFEIGISSLTLTEIVLALDEHYPGKIDINNLFDYPTIRELADYIRN